MGHVRKNIFMSRFRLAIRVVVCSLALSYWGLHLLLLVGTFMFGGPGEPGSSMSVEEFYVRVASDQWQRDAVDSFIVATVYCVAAALVVILATSSKTNLSFRSGQQKVSKPRMASLWLFLRLSLICICLFVCEGVRLRLGNPSDCGGNTAALAACKSFVTGLEIISNQRSNAPVSISDIKSSELSYVTNLAGLNLLTNSKVLVKPIAVGFFGGPKEIIAVCDRAFDNVPRRLFGKAPYTHAIAYADGSFALFTVEEFKGLDLTNFVDIRKIQAKDVELGGTAKEIAR